MLMATVMEQREPTHFHQSGVRKQPECQHTRLFAAKIELRSHLICSRLCFLEANNTCGILNYLCYTGKKLLPEKNTLFNVKDIER
jgi:hypothetical protein